MKTFTACLCLALTLSACTMPKDQYDYPRPTVHLETSKLNAEVGEAVTLTMTADIKLDRRSRVPETGLSQLKLGMCYGIGAVKNPFTVDHFGSCYDEVLSAPESYTAVDDQGFEKTFPNAVIRRGETQTLRFDLTMTMTEAGALTLYPILTYRDSGISGEEYQVLEGKNVFPVLTFGEDATQ